MTWWGNDLLFIYVYTCVAYTMQRTDRTVLTNNLYENSSACTCRFILYLVITCGIILAREERKLQLGNVLIHSYTRGILTYFLAQDSGFHWPTRRNKRFEKQQIWKTNNILIFLHMTEAWRLLKLLPWQRWEI